MMIPIHTCSCQSVLFHAGEESRCRTHEQVGQWWTVADNEAVVSRLIEVLEVRLAARKNKEIDMLENKKSKDAKVKKWRVNKKSMAQRYCHNF